MAGDQTTSIAATVDQSAPRLGIAGLGLAGALMDGLALQNRYQSVRTTFQLDR
jgi:hypothetical protein